MAIDPRMLRNLNLPSLENLQARMNPLEQSVTPQGLLPSNQGVGSGLLGGVQKFAGRVGQAVAPVIPQAARNIADMARFTAMQRASMPSLVTAQDLDKLRPIDPVAIAAQLPTLRAAEKEAMQKPMLDALKAKADLARASQSRQSLAAQKTAPKTFLLPDGKSTVETYFDKISGQRLISGTNEPLPAGSLEFGPSDLPTFKNLSEFNDRVTEEEQKLIALDKYKNALETAPDGLARTVQAMNMILQTLSSNPEFKKGDLATGRARAMLQGLIGRYKDDIVGGGVMTEQDALRVIEALGGQVSAFNPSALQISLIDDYRVNSKQKYDAALERYNKAYETTLPTMAGKRIFDKRDAYVNPYLQSPLTPDNGSDIDDLLDKYSE